MDLIIIIRACVYVILSLIILAIGLILIIKNSRPVPDIIDSVDPIMAKIRAGNAIKEPLPDIVEIIEDIDPDETFSGVPCSDRIYYDFRKELLKERPVVDRSAPKS